MTLKHKLLDDNLLVIETSKYLDIGEYEVFERAMGDKTIEEVNKHYDDYFRTGTIPMWVRHYCRNILEDD